MWGAASRSAHNFSSHPAVAEASGSSREVDHEIRCITRDAPVGSLRRRPYPGRPVLQQQRDPATSKRLIEWKRDFWLLIR
jgi:hypothetical protein